MKVKFIAALALLIAFLAPSAAFATDIPILTWERGRIQEVVLGGGAVQNNWVVKLVSGSGSAETFSESGKNPAGYVVYSLNLPGDFPLGGYTIVATGKGSPQTTVAAVHIVAMAHYDVTQVPRDLTWIIAMIAFLTATISAFRARKYASLEFLSTQIAPSGLDVYDITNEKSRLAQSFKPYDLRIKAIASLRPSLLRFLLLRDGELAHRISPMLYGVMPLIGVIAAFVASVEVNKAGTLASTGLAIFTAIALLGIFDAFSGVIATASFWLVQLVVGNVTSFRDLMVMLITGICWVAPGLFALIYRDAASRDLKKNIAKISGLVEAGVVGGLIFYSGQKVINSLLITITSARSISFVAILIVAAAVIARALVDDESTKQLLESGKDYQLEKIQVARVSSPESSFALFAGFFAVSYIWTQSAAKSLIFALLFAAPYFLLFISVSEVNIKALSKVRRNIFLEAIVSGAITMAIYQVIAHEPMLSTQKSQVYLLCAGIPGLLHAVYSAMCDSAERQGIMAP